MHVFKGLANVPAGIGFSKDGSRLIAGDQGSIIHVWDIASRKKIQSLNFHSLNYGETLYRLVSSNDYVFSVDELGNLALWDINLNTDNPIATNSVEVDQDEVAALTDAEFEFEDVQFRTVGNTKLQNVSEQQKNISEMNKELFIDLRKGTGTTIISSAGGVEFAFESSAWNNGLFTFCLLNNLKKQKGRLE